MRVRANKRGRERERECSLGLRGFFFVFPFCVGSGPRGHGFAQARACGQDQTESKIVLRYAQKNSKYNVLYILKTHKTQLELFKKITNSRNYEELCSLLEIKEKYEYYIKSSENMCKFYDNSYYKENYKKEILK